MCVCLNSSLFYRMHLNCFVCFYFILFLCGVKVVVVVTVFVAVVIIACFEILSRHIYTNSKPEVICSAGKTTAPRHGGICTGKRKHMHNAIQMFVCSFFFHFFYISPSMQLFYFLLLFFAVSLYTFLCTTQQASR